MDCDLWLKVMDSRLLEVKSIKHDYDTNSGSALMVIDYLL